MLAILTTHPIQYQVPLWQALAKDGRVPFEVWYLSDHATRKSFDSEFRQTFAWDLDMLSGYPSRFLKTNNNPDVARFSRLRLAEPLGDLIRKKDVTTLWIQGWQVAAYWQAVWQAHAVGVPVWLRGESNDLAAVSMWKKPVKHLVLSRLFDKVSEFLYIGKANRRFYENFGVEPQQLHPAYYCVDNERFKKQADELRPRRAELRRAWGIPEDSFCVLFAGKFIHKKRPLDIVEAAAKLRRENPRTNVHILFAGSGELGALLRQSCNVVFDAAANGNGIHRSQSTTSMPDASFTGFLNQKEISRAYVAADCLVLPSDSRETWGLVVNEAMASGLPCIVSDGCGCAEDLVSPIRSDFCFPLGDSASISRAIAGLCEVPAKVEELSREVAKVHVGSSVQTVAALYSSSLRILRKNSTIHACFEKSSNAESVG